jgi:hypothetical protein
VLYEWVLIDLQLSLKVTSCSFKEVFNPTTFRGTAMDGQYSREQQLDKQYSWLQYVGMLSSSLQISPERPYWQHCAEQGCSSCFAPPMRRGAGGSSECASLSRYPLTWDRSVSVADRFAVLVELEGKHIDSRYPDYTRSDAMHSGVM